MLEAGAGGLGTGFGGKGMNSAGIAHSDGAIPALFADRPKLRVNYPRTSYTDLGDVI
jgi:hypothetical protein